MEATRKECLASTFPKSTKANVFVTNAEAGEVNTLTLASSILGMVLGTAGFVMGVLNHLRDRAKVKLTLQWKMQSLETGEQRGLVRITNIGRRPVFISMVALELPKGHDHTHLILMKSLDGTKLGEGDRPMGVFVPYEGLAQYSKVWRKMRAYAEDSTGKQYHSKYPAKDTPTPPWVVP
jgi:hypothetical protein